MARSKDTFQKRSDAHLSDGEIMAIIDKELESSASAEVIEHLESCWRCLARRQQLEATIFRLVQYRQGVLLTFTPPPQEGPERFVARLDAQISSECTKRSVGRQIWQVFRPVFEWPMLHLNVASAAAALALFAVIFFGWRRETPSVNPPLPMTLLQQAAVVDNKVFDTPGSVVHRVLILHKRTSSGEETQQKIELWRRTGEQQAAVRMYSRAGKLVAATWQSAGQKLVYQNAKLKPAVSLAENSLTKDAIWQLTPTAATFSNLSRHTGRISLEETPEIYVLRYEAAQGSGSPRLLNATLTLRRQNLHAIEQTLRVEERGQVSDYRFIEAEYEQRPAAEVAASVFQVNPEIEAAPTQVMSAVRLQPVISGATADVHLEVLNRLDQANALLNELRIRHDAKGPLVIEGIVGTEERKQELLLALGPLSRNATVRLAIKTADEVERPTNAPAARLYVSSVEGSAEKGHVNPQLRQYLAATQHFSGAELDKAVARFSYGIVDHLAEAERHALILNQIVEELSGELESLTPQSRQQWHSLVKKHAHGAQTELAAAREQLAPVFRPSTPNSAKVAHPSDLKQAATRLAELTSSINKQTWKALGLSSADDSSAQFDSPALWQNLHSAEQLAEALAERIQ